MSLSANDIKRGLWRLIHDGDISGAGNDPKLSAQVVDLINNASLLFIEQDAGGNSVLKNIFYPVTALAYAATVDIDFLAGGVRTLALAGDVTFTTSNLAAGRGVSIKILADGSARNFTFPAWKFVGNAAPASIAAGKTAILSLFAYGSSDTDVVASYAVES